MKLTTDIPCPYGTTAGKDCPGCLNGETNGKYVVFTCNDCGTTWGIGSTDDMEDNNRRKEFAEFSNKVHTDLRKGKQ